MMSSYLHNEYNQYVEYDEDSEEEKNAQMHAQIATWNKQSNRLRSSGNHVYILTLEEVGHDHEPWFRTIGIFDSKAAAVAKSVTVNTVWGTFDEAIKDMFSAEYDHKDNRMNPPDDGVLIEVGGEGCGEGDYSRLMIKRQSILSLDEPNLGHPNKMTTKTDGKHKLANRRRKKRKKSELQDVIVLSSDDSGEE